MKKGKSNTPALLIMLALVAIIFYLITRLQDPKIVKVPVPTPMAPPRPITSIRRSPEYRDPPVKLYKPGDVQQMGVLIGENEETLPLYGKEVRGRRDQYHYYTSTPGDQIYSIPVTIGDRDCMDDIGCRELYGNESVNVLGKAAPYQAKLYRTDHFF